MKIKDKKQIKNLIDALQMLGFKRKNNADFLPIFIDRAICNPFKLSYISKQKSEKLKQLPLPEFKEEVEQVKSGEITEEIRSKYFKATNIEKFFNLYFDINTDEERNLFSSIINKFKVKFFGNQKFRMKTFGGEEIAEIYSGENENFRVLANGSCMQAPYNEVFHSWFTLYSSADVQLICLYQGKNIVARSLLWEDLQNNNFFLDRIYICNEFNEETKQKIQTDLYKKVCKKLNVKYLNCYSRTHILRHLKTDRKANEKQIEQIETKTLSEPKQNFVIFSNCNTLDNYPYLDTFKYYNEREGTLSANRESAYNEYLDRTDGHENSCTCDGCNENFDEDNIHWSELEGCYICDDCAVYLEDREETVFESSATYDNYREVYVYSNDLG
jgi:hypothetical protein